MNMRAKLKTPKDKLKYGVHHLLTGDRGGLNTRGICIMPGCLTAG